MARTLVAFALVALVVAPAWLRLEEGPIPVGATLTMILLALAPALAVALRRGRGVFAAVVALSTLLAASAAFEISIAEARLGKEHDFFGPVLSGFKQGFLEFSDTKVPYNPVDYPFMHAVVLLAIFGFVAAAGIAIALREPFAALAVLVVGAGWPATMLSTWVESAQPLLTGALILAAAFALLLLLRPGARGLGYAGLVGAVLLIVAVAGSTTDAVAKRGFVDWDTWDFYDEPEDPVSVRYVWDANYDGIKFPVEQTTVLKIKVPGPRRALYWRATTLDDYTGQVWRENIETAAGPDEFEEIDVREADPLLPEAARARELESLVRQDVTVMALDDVHLIGSAQVVRWQPETSSPARVGTNGAVVLGRPLRREQRYTVWSYVPQVKPGELKDAGTEYPEEALRYLRPLADPAVPHLPVFGEPGRGDLVESFLAAEFLESHRPMLDLAREVTQDATSPYEAAVLLEAWFRGSEGGFVYDEQPNEVAGPDEPPLVHFLATKRGYCQHYAGAMAVMLRYVGVPARVAAGFVSGSYDDGENEWTVTDHDAHTWVEVYFPGHGWIPFDPTPNRGQLSAAYTPFSPAFDAREAAQLGGPLSNVPEVREQISQGSGLEQREPDAGPGGGGGVPEAVAETGRSVIGLVLLLGGLGAAAILLVKEGRRRARFIATDPRQVAAACRRDLVGYMADQGYETSPSMTLRELCALVADRFSVNTKPFLETAVEARYAPPRPGSDGVRRLRAELRRLRRRMGRQLGLRQRLRGALSLRSLAA